MTVDGGSTQSKAYGMAGLLGAAVFTAALIVLHAARTEGDWREVYVSHFVHGRLGWLFVSGAVVHGLGNLTLGEGLRRSLRPGRLRTWAVLLFGIAAASMPPMSVHTRFTSSLCANTASPTTTSPVSRFSQK